MQNVTKFKMVAVSTRVKVINQSVCAILGLIIFNSVLKTSLRHDYIVVWPMF